MQDGFKISLPASPRRSPRRYSQRCSYPPNTVTQSAACLRAADDRARPAQPPAPLNNAATTNFEHLLGEYQAHQSETLRLHEQYLRIEEEYARAFAQLTQLQSELVSKGAANSGSGELQAVLPLFESLERSMTRFHDHQAETLRVHQRYLETQERFSQSFVSSVQNSGSAVPSQAAPQRMAPPAAPRPEPAVRQPEPAVQQSEPGVYRQNPRFKDPNLRRWFASQNPPPRSRRTAMAINPRR